MIALRRPSHRIALAGGLALIALVNAVALGGVYWNRSHEESRLLLTQRELRLPYSYQPANGEDPGVRLAFEWHRDAHCKTRDMCYYSDETSWLDAGKLAALGFDVAEPPREDMAREQRRQQREVLVVLEFEGPAYIEYLRNLEDDLHRAQAREAQAGKPGDPVAEAAAPVRGAIEAATASIDAARTEVKASAEQLRKGAREDSRLFAVDAGLDADALRRKYPDRRHYAFVRGLATYTPAWDRGHFHANGHLAQLLGPEINLPRPFVEQLGITSGYAYTENNSAHYAAEVAFGRAQEPWIESLRRTQAPR